MDEDSKAAPAFKSKYKIGFTIIGVIMFVIGLVVVKELKESYLIRESHQMLDQKFDELKAKALAEHPNKLTSVAVQEEAKKQSIQSLERKSGDAKADVAAGQFVGFYLINVKARFEYCKDIGVDISAFINAFVYDHAELYAISRKIHNQGPNSADRIESELLAQINPTMKRTIHESTEEYAKQNQMTVVEVCEALQTNAVEVAKQMRLMMLNPTLYNALIQYK